MAEHLNEEWIDALVVGYVWADDVEDGVTEVLVSFPGEASLWPSGPGNYGPGGTQEPYDGFGPLDDAERTAVRAALKAWADVAGLEFPETPDDATGYGTLRFSWTAAGPDEQSHAYTFGNGGKTGDVWLNAEAAWDGLEPGRYGWSTLLHELGHVLGLRGGGDALYAMPPEGDGYAASLMSYNAWAGEPGSWVDFEPTTPMVYDVLAIQYLYGENDRHRTGDDTYVFHEGARYFETVWDAGGNDTFVWDAQSQGGLIDLNAGTFSRLGVPLTYWSADFSRSWTDDDTVAIAFGTDIENARGGGGADTLVGNDLDNLLEGAGGDDTIDGGAGRDHAIFDSTRARNAVVNLGSGVIRVTGPEGDDTLTGVERLVFSDVSLGFDVDGTGGKTFRLYKAAYDREPDPEGLGFWLYYLDNGFDMVQAADNFLNADEFRLMYDVDPQTPGYQAPSDEQYCYLVYKHVLQREPDPEGYRFWVDAMSNEGGIYGHAWTKGEVLILFAESEENQANTAELIGQGFEYLEFVPTA